MKCGCVSKMHATNYSVFAVISSQAMWWRMRLFKNFFFNKCLFWAHASVDMYVHGDMASSWALISFSLSLESEWGCVYPTFTLKISSSDAADTGSFKPLSSSSSTVRSPEMALRISGPMSCNVRRPAYTQTRQTAVLHSWNNTLINMLILVQDGICTHTFYTFYSNITNKHRFMIKINKTCLCTCRERAVLGGTLATSPCSFLFLNLRKYSWMRKVA